MATVEQLQNWEARHGHERLAVQIDGTLYFPTGAQCSINWDTFREPPTDPHENLIARHRYTKELLARKIRAFDSVQNGAIEQAEAAKHSMNVIPPAPQLVKDKLIELRAQIGSLQQQLAEMDGQLAAMPDRHRDFMAAQRERSTELEAVKHEIGSITLADLPNGAELLAQREAAAKREAEIASIKANLAAIAEQSAFAMEVFSAALGKPAPVNV